MDRSGRLNDHGLLDALGWSPDQPRPAGDETNDLVDRLAVEESARAANPPACDPADDR